MNNKIRDFLNKGKEKLRRRLCRKTYEDQKHPLFRGSNIRYSVTEKEGVIGYGGIGAMHSLVRRLKLDRLLNQGVRLLQRPVPYHASDLVLSMTYNILTGGICLEDLKRLRQDESSTKELGAERIPDATAAGDFLRRFDEPSVLVLQEAIMEARKKVWRQQTAAFLEVAIWMPTGRLPRPPGNARKAWTSPTTGHGITHRW